MPPRLILLLALAIAAALYWAGLNGPFIFDDSWNLEMLRLWHSGQASLREVIFPHASIVLSRPVAMLSFVLTTQLFGDTSFSFKLGNLIVHLACGILCWAVLRRVLARDVRLAPHAELLAALATALWLLHPLQVSTVLYAVQRMAQLSALFTLAAVWFYLVGRQQLTNGHPRVAKLNLFVGFPAMLVLGILSKQNAAVAPAICLVLELAYFSRTTRPGRSVATFFGVFLGLPALGVIALLALKPAMLLGTYAEWNFTLWERLLTQSRVLMDYLGMLLIPRGALMGLYTDDFVVSSGLFSPVSTLACILALAGISALVVTLRKRAPSVFAGWLFFLVAHSVESTFLPLEMYYEHRNYLPSLGLLLAVAGLIALVPTVRTNVISLRKLGLVAISGFTLVLCLATLNRVMVWRDWGTIAQLGMKTHPDSLRARFDVAAWSLQRGDFETGMASMRYLAASRDPQHRQLGNLSLVAMNCMRGTGAQGLESLQRASAENQPRLTTFEAQSFVRMAGSTKEKGCGDLTRAVIASHLQRILDSTSTQPETASPKWFSRFALAEIYARDGQWQSAQQQAELAWEGGHDKKIGVFLVAIYVQNGELAAAKPLLAQLNLLIKPYDMQGQAALADLRNLLAKESASGATADSSQ